MPEIRDFVYLDIERVRSFVAQSVGGVPTERSVSGEHQAGGSASGGAGVPLLAKLEGQADYHYVRSTTETRSVQDAIFEEFSLKCPPLDVTEIPWPDDAAVPDGRVILVRGHIKIVDYLTSIEALRSFPKILATYQRFLGASSSQPTAGKARTALQGAPNKAQAEALGPMVESISKLAGTNLTDFVRVKVLPDISKPDQAFVGDAERHCFRYQTSVLSALYPGGMAEGWSCVGVVHRPSKSSLPVARGGETLGDMLESLLDLMSGLAAFQQVARPPEIAITPLAIFRKLAYE